LSIYLQDAAMKSEGIEALVYASDDLFKRLNLIRGSDDAVDPIYDAVKDIVDKVNKNLATYARISKITVLDEPLEMTTTRKVKRKYTK